jgi:hypothetical protein
VACVDASGHDHRLGNAQLTVKTVQLHQEITTTDFLNPSLGTPENKTFIILSQAFMVLQSPLLKTGSSNVLDAARHTRLPDSRISN